MSTSSPSSYAVAPQPLPARLGAGLGVEQLERALDREEEFVGSRACSEKPTKTARHGCVEPTALGHTEDVEERFGLGEALRVRSEQLLAPVPHRRGGEDDGHLVSHDHHDERMRSRDELRHEPAVGGEDGFESGDGLGCARLLFAGFACRRRDARASDQVFGHDRSPTLRWLIDAAVV